MNILKNNFIQKHLIYSCLIFSTSSANAAAFVLLGESVPLRFSGRAIFLMASATMFAQFIISGKLIKC